MSVYCVVATLPNLLFFLELGQALGNLLFHTTRAGQPYQFYRPDCTSNPGDEQVDITPLWRGLANKIMMSF